MAETTDMDSAGLPSQRQVKSGILWITGISIFRDGVQFGLTLLLVRLLDPKAYGEFSLVNAFISLFTVVSTRSFLEHTIQIRPGEKVDYQAQFTWGAATQSAAIAGMIAAALVLRRFPKYFAASTPLMVMSVFFVLDWAGELRVKMLERDLNWTRLRLLEAAGLALATCAAVLLALSGAGVYALLLPLLIAPAPFALDLFAFARWRPAWSFEWRSFRPAWHYGLTRIASGIVARGQQILESTFIVGLVGLASFGIYGRAVGLASFSCLKLTSLLTLTVFPVLTRFEPGSVPFRRASTLIFRAVAWTSIPVAVLLSLVAAEVIRLLFGSKWTAVAPLLPWALAIASLTALTEAAAFLLLANLQPRRTLAIDVWILAGTAASLVFLLPRGIIVYMAGVIATQTVATVCALGWLLRSGALKGRGIAGALLPPAGISGFLLAASALIHVGRNSVQGTTVFVLGWAAAYLLTLRFLFAEDLLEILEWMPASRLVRRAFLFGGKRDLLNDQAVR